MWYFDCILLVLIYPMLSCISISTSCVKCAREKFKHSLVPHLHTLGQSLCGLGVID